MSIRDLASEAVQLVSGVIASKGVKVEISPNIPTVRADRSRMLQALQNLIENAVKFMGEQSHPRIEIGARVDHGETVFFVRDNGIGVDPMQQQRIFALFTRGHETGEGIGLGLALVKRIVQVHGGRIWVESQGRGKGSTFCFTLGDK